MTIVKVGDIVWQHWSHRQPNGVTWLHWRANHFAKAHGPSYPAQWVTLGVAGAQGSTYALTVDYRSGFRRLGSFKTPMQALRTAARYVDGKDVKAPLRGPRRKAR